MAKKHGSSALIMRTAFTKILSARGRHLKTQDDHVFIRSREYNDNNYPCSNMNTAMSPMLETGFHADYKHTNSDIRLGVRRLLA